MAVEEETPAWLVGLGSGGCDEGSEYEWIAALIPGELKNQLKSLTTKTNQTAEGKLTTSAEAPNCPKIFLSICAPCLQLSLCASSLTVGTEMSFDKA